MISPTTALSRELYVQWVGTNRTDCNPSDLVKTNQWVCVLALRFVRITDKSAVDCGGFVIVLLTDLLIKC